MPVVSQQNSSLQLTLDGEQVNCQLTSVGFTRPARSAPTVMLTACPDGQVSEPGAWSAGTLTAEVIGDTSDTGISWLMDQAVASGAEVAYVLTFFDDQADIAVEFTGQATVEAFEWPFSRPGLFKHSLSMTIISATAARPA